MTTDRKTPVSSKTRRQTNREIQQDELRKRLRAGGHIQHAIECIGKMERARNAFSLAKAKAVFDSQMKLSCKYLPDLKQTDMKISGDADNPLRVERVERVVITPVAAKVDNSADTDG